MEPKMLPAWLTTADRIERRNATHSKRKLKQIRNLFGQRDKKTEAFIQTSIIQSLKLEPEKLQIFHRLGNDYQNPLQIAKNLVTLLVNKNVLGKRAKGGSSVTVKQ